MRFDALRTYFVPLGVAILWVAVLANNAVLGSEESPPRSWQEPRVTDEETELRLTFQVDPGDRLTIDVGRSLFHLGISPRLGGATVHVYQAPPMDPGPPLTGLTPLHSYTGDYVNEAPRGLYFKPEAPMWTLRGEGWWTYVVILRHGDYEPPAGTARTLWARGLMQDLAASRTWGETSSYTLVPNHALVLQPLFYVVEAAALAACLAGAFLSRRGNVADANGLEQGVRLAVQAREWLSTLHQLLWITTLGLAALGFTVLLLLGGAGLHLWTGLYPDAFYPVWMPVALAVAFAVGAGGLVRLLVRVRRASRNVPGLTLDA